MMTFLEWRKTFSTEDVYQRLVAAGLGDMSQEYITRTQYNRAMAGEVVIRLRKIGSGRRKVFRPYKLEREA